MARPDPSRVLARFSIKASKTLPRVGARYDGYFYGTRDGKWWFTSSPDRADWEAMLGTTSKNAGKVLSLEGATEHHAGFRSALNEMAREYPELLSFAVKFDGPLVPVSQLVNDEPNGKEPAWHNILFYHGTSSWAAERILREGLRPRSATNVEPAYGAGLSVGAGRVDAIYLTTQLSMAHYAAIDAAKSHKGEPVILAVKGIDGQYVAADEDSRQTDPAVSLARIGSIAYVSTIPASKIETHETLEGGHWIRASTLVRTAKEWPSKLTLDHYLELHPKADRTKHWVKGDPNHAPKSKDPSKGSKKRPAKEPAKAKAPPAPKKRVIPGRGEIEIKRTVFDKRVVDDLLEHRYDDQDTALYLQLMERAAGGKKSSEYYGAQDWTYSWQCSSEPESIEEFMNSVHTQGSWANLKYSATQTLIEAEKEKLIESGVMDRDGYVTLYRGVGPPQSEQLVDEDNDPDVTGCDLGVRGLSSWSESKVTAFNFSTRDGYEGKVLKSKIHYSRIVNFWRMESMDWNGEKEWTVMGDEKEDASIECTFMSTDERTHYASEQSEPKPKKKITLDDNNENWLRKVTLERLRKKGWKGTLKEYYDQKSKKDKR